MTIIAQSESISVTNPKLWFAAQTTTGNQTGLLVDVASLDFQLYDISTDEKRLTPLAVGSKTAVDLDNHKLGTGRYAATADFAADAVQGRWAVRWYYKVNATDDEKTEWHEFEVVKNVDGLGAYEPLYAMPSDLQDEELLDNKSLPYRLQRLALASRYIERVTRRRFVPEYRTMRVDGTGTGKIILTDPIVAIESVGYETGIEDSTLFGDLLRVYNRHLTQGITHPDDRAVPKLELFYLTSSSTQLSTLTGTNLTFPRGAQNIEVKGIFGFTEPDSTMVGRTPYLIRHACKLLVLREQFKLNETAARDDALKRFRIKSEKTRDQSYTLESMATTGGIAAFTGDSNIDSILAMFVRPPVAGGA